MIDTVDPATRSRMMAAVRGAHTRPEMAVRRSLHAAGLRYRLHVRGLPGRPDIVLASRRLAVFVHGCFWHRHAGCRLTTTPATRPEFWAAKFTANMRRDAVNAEALAADGWKVLTVWECQTRDSAFIDRFVADVRRMPADGRAGRTPA